VPNYGHVNNFILCALCRELDSFAEFNGIVMALNMILLKRYLRLGLVVLVITPFIVPFFLPWSRINCCEQKVDILSGRTKHTRYLYWIPITNSVSGNPVSEAIFKKLPDNHRPQWKSANTFGPYTQHSPHHIFHSAISQMRNLELIWEMYDFDPEKRKESALALLHEWQTNNSDSSADDYLQKLVESNE
jgi:hypothetical protein